MEIRREAYLNQLNRAQGQRHDQRSSPAYGAAENPICCSPYSSGICLKAAFRKDHIIEIALDGIENEELRDPKVCFR